MFINGFETTVKMNETHFYNSVFCNIVSTVNPKFFVV